MWGLATCLSARSARHAAGQKPQGDAARHRGAARVDAELAVDALGVRPKRVQRDQQLGRQLRATEFAREQAQHFDFALTQLLAQTRYRARRSLGLAERAEQSPRVLGLLFASE